MAVTIYHNPRCSKSRQTLNLLTERGIDPTIIDYLNTPPSIAELCRILELLKLTPRQLLRSKEAKDAGLLGPDLTDEALIAAMVQHPGVIQRPIVIHGHRAALGRPPEAVLDIL